MPCDVMDTNHHKFAIIKPEKVPPPHSHCMTLVLAPEGNSIVQELVPIEVIFIPPILSLDPLHEAGVRNVRDRLACREEGREEKDDFSPRD